jgi:hypothetical protein
MGPAGHVARIGRWGVHTGFCWRNLRERDNLEDPGIGGRIILRFIFSQCDGGGGGMDWIWLGSGEEQVAGACERGSEPSGFMNTANFLNGWWTVSCWSRTVLQGLPTWRHRLWIGLWSIKLFGESEYWFWKMWTEGVVTELELLSGRLSGDGEENHEENSIDVALVLAEVWTSQHPVFILSTGRVCLRFLLYYSEQRLHLPSILSFFPGWTVLGSNSSRGKRYSCFQNRPDWVRGPLRLLFKGYRDYVPGWNDWGVKLTTNHLVLRIGMGGAIPLLTLYVLGQLCIVL